MKVPEHLERGVGKLVDQLQALTGGQLSELGVRTRQRIDPTTATLISGRLVWENPVDGVDDAIRDLGIDEHNHRYDVLQSMEADMNGGHLVAVWSGDEMGKFAAVCDPTPPGEFCWHGPDRDTVEEATNDGRAHHPGYEPAVREQ